VDRDSRELGGHSQRIGLDPGLFRSTEHAGDGIAPLEKGIQNGLPEILLTDDRDTHMPPWHQDIWYT
jgi:hypothetical protein